MRYVIRQGESKLLADAFTLIQVVNNANLVENTSKRRQYRSLESNVRERLPFGSLRHYFLFDSTEQEFRTGDAGQRLRTVAYEVVHRYVDAGAFV